MGRPRDEEREERILDLWETGMPHGRIAEEAGCSRRTVARVLKRAGLTEQGLMTVTPRETVEEPSPLERWAQVYPDEPRREWITKQLLAWRARVRGE